MEALTMKDLTKEQYDLLAARLESSSYGRDDVPCVELKEALFILKCRTVKEFPEFDMRDDAGSKVHFRRVDNAELANLWVRDRRGCGQYVVLNIEMLRTLADNCLEVANWIERQENEKISK